VKECLPPAVVAAGTVQSKGGHEVGTGRGSRVQPLPAVSPFADRIVGKRVGTLVMAVISGVSFSALHMLFYRFDEPAEGLVLFPFVQI
jgi:hypothetical protein